MDKKILTPPEALQALLDGKKLCSSEWKFDFIHIINKRLVDKYNQDADLDLLLNYSWEIYEEPKPKKRYWIWSFKFKNPESPWRKYDNYLDDNGVETNGLIDMDNFDELEKIKHENEFIDI